MKFIPVEVMGPLRLQRKPLDGQQVEPALTEPENVQGLKPVKVIGSRRANSPSGSGHL